MIVNNGEQPSDEKSELSVSERNLIQAALIQDFCRIKEIEDPERRNTRAIEWIEKYADNFGQLDKSLIEKYQQAGNDSERSAALDEIQKSLEMLDQRNG